MRPIIRNGRSVQSRSPARGGGFTLIELVIAIVLSGIVAIMAASFLTQPMEGYAALGRRAELVDMAEMALRRMQREEELQQRKAIINRYGLIPPSAPVVMSALRSTRRSLPITMKR